MRFRNEPLGAFWKTDEEVPGVAVIELWPDVYFAVSVGEQGYEFYGATNDNAHIFHSEEQAWHFIRSRMLERRS